MKYKSIVPWIFVISWAGCIFYLSHQPGNESSQLSASILVLILQWLENILPFQVDVDLLHTVIRKSAHFFAYFLLGILFYWALGKRKYRSMIALFLSLMYAISDEVHQLFILGRSGEFRDVLIDTSGALTGILLVLCLKSLFFLKK